MTKYVSKLNTRVGRATALAVLLCLASVSAHAAEGVGLDGFEQRIAPLLKTHCIKCHGGEKTKGSVDLTKMTSKAAILGNEDVWRRALDALDFEDMPPDPEKTGFTKQDRELLMTWIRDAALTVDVNAAELRHPGPAFIRQLTPYEYMRTVQDLLYMDEIPFARFGIEQEYPQESLEYVNQALKQTLSVTEFDRYLRTGDEVLKQLFNDESGAWHKTGARHRQYRKIAEAARPKVLFVEPGKDGVTDEVAAKQIIERFATRAFRRPLQEHELSDLLAVYRKSRELGGTHEESLRHAMTPVLASPHFLMRIEKNQAPAGSDKVYPVTAHELATRLSYFLWSTMPDDQLRGKADSGELLKDDVLAAEITRMLADDKAGSLAEHFAYQWLQLNLMKLPSVPTRKGFPKLTSEVEAAFKEEIRVFVDRVRLDDRSILDFLDSDYTYVNRNLAEFYGVTSPDVKKLSKQSKGRVGEMVRVSLKPEDNRGGLLGMGGVLWMTSHESRTKPTSRGKWILEALLGTPPPPPPAEAGSFVPPAEGQPEPKNFREKLELHASDPACSGCHKKIDPLGFALENFDAVGSWREKDGKDPIDNVGRLPSGESIDGFEALQGVLMARKDQFARNLVQQMLRYALGRELLYSDRGTVELITQHVKEEDYRFSALIKGVAMSRAFRDRVNLDAALGAEGFSAASGRADTE